MRGGVPAVLAMLAGTVLVGSSVAGCSGPDQHGSAQQRVDAWVSSSDVGETIGTLQGDDSAITKGVAVHLTPNALHAVCAGLETDASDADGNLPAPDSQITDDLSSAYHDEVAAAGDCFTGASGNAALLDRSSVERGHALALMSAAFARIIQVTGMVPSTTTTTSAGGESDAF